MQSKNYAVLSRDKRFADSFDFNAHGELTVLCTTEKTSSVSAEGFVEYRVSGDRPSILQTAPPILLDGTIGFIKANIKDFVSKQFVDKFLRAYSRYTSIGLPP